MHYRKKHAGIRLGIEDAFTKHDSTRPPEQATPRRSQSYATDGEGSDERYYMYSYILCCVVPMSAVIDCYRGDKNEQETASHTSPGSDER
ncbi:unnamed protein product [Clavelina lepadiformis]|uniref:Uncharacterized protein n=1 Tax=Clavelina lepadiformis TaxID=159417 RepID=A0ABP0G2X9_CLALP